MKFPLFILAFALATVSYSQTGQRPPNSSVENQQILKRLSEIERSDSVERASRAVDKAVAGYLKDLAQDNQQHRAFIMDIYLYTIAGAGVIIAVMTIIGLAGFTNGLVMINRFLRNRLRKVMEEKEAEVDNMVKEFKGELSKQEEQLKKQQEELKKQTDINTEQAKKLDSQDSKIDNLVFDLSILRKNQELVTSATVLEYLDPKGAAVVWTREQEIICISDEYPIKDTVDRLEVDPGTVEFIEASEEGVRNTLAETSKNVLRIRLFLQKPLARDAGTFKKLLKAKLLSSFPNDKESWTITQHYPCGDDTFELRLPKTRKCNKAWLEQNVKDAQGNDRKEVIGQIELKEEEKYYSYKVTLPPQEKPFVPSRVFTVRWEF